MEFIPTYLYIKQHSITGKLYFGKTTKDPNNYKGSGKHWSSHYKKHGKEYIVTLWHELFTNKDELCSFAKSFSESLDIVQSNSWLNLIPENGLDGAPVGNRGGMLGKTHSQETKDKIGISHKGKIVSEESKYKI